MRIKSLGFLALAVICLANEPLFAATAEKTKDDRVVKDGMLVTLDFTLKSPAGKTLVFDIKVVDIQPAPPPPALPSTPAAPAKPSAPAQPAKPADPAQKK